MYTFTEPSSHAPMQPLGPGTRLPSFPMVSTNGGTVDLSATRGEAILLLHPVAVPPDYLPAAEETSFRAVRAGIETLLLFEGIMPHLVQNRMQVFGISVQSAVVQRMVADNLGLSFPLLSDSTGAFARSTELPLIRHGRRGRLPALIVVAKDGIVQRRIIPDATLDPLAVALGKSRGRRSD